MKITSIESWSQPVRLKRPYSIAGHRKTDVTLHFARILGNGVHIGLGSASPSQRVTGESADACQAALDGASRLWTGKSLASVDDLAALAGPLTREMQSTPAAQAALDMALWDLLGHHLGRPVVRLLDGSGEHAPRPTSITIGIQSVERTLESAREYLERGFRCIKIKLGDDVDEDIERLHRLRETVGAGVAIRADANEGYDERALRRVLPVLDTLDIEFLEQPMSRDDEAILESLSDEERRRVALDESVQRPIDAVRWEQSESNCGTWVVKLMKCGGITPAMEIAEAADRCGTTLMWGCMDESVISIAASLHAASASRATRYLDLDGSFDLAEDPASGGFTLRDGMLSLTDRPGLGVATST